MKVEVATGIVHLMANIICAAVENINNESDLCFMRNTEYSRI